MKPPYILLTDRQNLRDDQAAESIEEAVDKANYLMAKQPEGGMIYCYKLCAVREFRVETIRTTVDHAIDQASGLPKAVS